MDKPYELRITARCRKNAIAPVSLTDFAAEPVAPVEPQWLIRNPNINLYCLDAATAQAVFVELAPDVNLAAVPFVYQAQYEGAQRLFTMSYPHLLQLTESLETKLDRLILLFNVSRCGSTLLHQIFNLAPGVVSLSEPDGLIPFWSQESRLPANEAIALMRATAKFSFRSQAFPQLAVPAIKFRGRNLMLLDLYHAAFPQATLLFLYRDVMSWIASWERVLPRLDMGTNLNKTPLDTAVAALANLFAQPIALTECGLGNLTGPLSRVQQHALTWVIGMDYYLKQIEQGLPVTAWRYTDLNHRRRETLHRLFATCDLPVDAVESALTAFEQDSQLGTLMARAEESQGNQLQLTDEQKEEIRAVVRCHPIIQGAEFLAPRTVV